MDIEPFRQAMLRLVNARDLWARHGGNWWSIGDVEVRGDVLVGVIGVSKTRSRHSFNKEEWSWLKGDVRIEEGADPSALAPFAVSLQERERWVAFSPSGYLNQRSFPAGLKAALRGQPWGAPPDSCSWASVPLDP